jgi:hypothetical protein
VDEHVFGHVQAGGHQDRRPEHGVELEDVLADDVVGRRPEAPGQILAGTGVAERRVVVQQRVEPHVEDVTRVPRDLDAPRQATSRQRYVLEPLSDERVRLVEVMARHHEVGPVAIELLERRLEAREAKEVVLLGVADERDLVDRAAVARGDLVLHLEVGAARAVPALVEPEVDVAVVVHALQHLLDLGLVGLVGGADEEVVGRPEARHQGLEALGVEVRELLGLKPLGVRRVGDRLAVLVGAGEEEHVLAALAHVAREHVYGDRGVRVAQVRLGVHVVDGSGDVKRHRGRRRRLSCRSWPSPRPIAPSSMSCSPTRPSARVR